MAMKGHACGSARGVRRGVLLILLAFHYFSPGVRADSDCSSSDSNRTEMDVIQGTSFSIICHFPQQVEGGKQIFQQKTTGGYLLLAKNQGRNWELGVNCHNCHFEFSPDGRVKITFSNASLRHGGTYMCLDTDSPRPENACHVNVHSNIITCSAEHEPEHFEPILLQCSFNVDVKKTRAAFFVTHSPHNEAAEHREELATCNWSPHNPSPVCLIRTGVILDRESINSTVRFQFRRDLRHGKFRCHITSTPSMTDVESFESEGCHLKRAHRKLFEDWTSSLTSKAPALRETVAASVPPQVVQPPRSGTNGLHRFWPSSFLWTPAVLALVSLI